MLDTVLRWSRRHAAAPGRAGRCALHRSRRCVRKLALRGREAEIFNLDRRPLVVFPVRRPCRGRPAAAVWSTFGRSESGWPATRSTSPPRSPIRTARPTSATPTRSIATDAIARFKRLDGYDVFFMTGIDEHGLKMPQTAAREGLTPQAAGRPQRAAVRAMGDRLDVLLRPLHPHDASRAHHASSQEIWRRMEANGDIYLGNYAGWYSVRDEAFYDESETQLSGRRPASGRRAPRSSGRRRRPTSSACRPTRTACWSSMPTSPASSGRRPGATRS